jgi:hypothetical protein
VTIVLVAALLALLLSLLFNAKQFLSKLDLVQRRDELLVQFKVGRSGRIQEATEKQLRDFDNALQAYNLAAPNAQDLEAVSTRELVQDLRLLSTITDYARAAGWAHAFSVVSGIRVRFIVNRFVMARLPSAAEPVTQQVDQLLKLLHAWATLCGFYDDFTQPLAFTLRGEAAQTTWPDLPAAESVAKETQDVAQALLRRLGTAP